MCVCVCVFCVCVIHGNIYESRHTECSNSMNGMKKYDGHNIYVIMKIICPHV